MSSNEINTALTPSMQTHFDQIIKAKDRADGVTEGELFAGVAYHTIIDQSGAAAGREYLKMVNEERAKGSGLFLAAKVALNKMGKFFAKTKFQSKKNAAKLGENLEREIRKTASASSQLDGKTRVSNRKDSAKDAVEAYNSAAGTYLARQNSKQEQGDIDTGDTGGGSGGDIDVINSAGMPDDPSELSMIGDQIRQIDNLIKQKIASLDPSDEHAYRTALGELQILQDTRKALRDLETNIVKSRGEALQAIARNIR